MKKDSALFKKVLWFGLASLAFGGIYDLSHAPTVQSLSEPPGPKTPSSLNMSVSSVDIGFRFDTPYTNVFSKANNQMDVVSKTGLSLADNEFGISSTLVKAEYKAIRVTLEDTGTYTGINPCDGTDVTDTDVQNNDPRSLIQLPGGESGVKGQVVMNFMEPHPVTGLQAGFTPIQHFTVSSTPLEFRMIYRASNSVICASSNSFLSTKTGSGLSVPEGIALDPVNHQIAVTNSDVSTVEFYESNTSSHTNLLSIAGASTELNKPIGVYVDTVNNEIGVANSGNHSITVYDRTALTGIVNDVPPKQPALIGDATGLSSPAGIVLDPINGQMIVANGGNNSITVYHRTDSGNTAPLQKILREDFTITSSDNTINLTESGGVGNVNATIPLGSYATGADLAIAVRSALEAAATSTQFSVTYNSSSKKFNIDVTAFGGGVSSVTLNWDNLATTAEGTLGFYPLSSGPLFAGSIDTSDFGDLTGLNVPCGVYVDTVNNEIGVTNNGNNSVTVYERNAIGNAIPKRTIVGSNTGLSNPCGIYFDTNHNEIGVVNSGTSTITIYDRLANGNIAPIRTVRGSFTGLTNPVGIYLNAQNDEIGVVNHGNSTLTFHQRVYSNVQLKELPLLQISPTQEVLFPQYYYNGTIDIPPPNTSNTADGDPNSIIFDGNKFVWKITSDQLRQAGDVSGATLIPPSDVIFELMDGSPVSTLPLDCSQFTPFIIVQLSTNCGLPRILSPTPVASGKYTIPAVMFKQTIINKLSVPQSVLPESEFPRPVPNLSLSQTINPRTNQPDYTINGINWFYVNEPPIINSQDVQIVLTGTYGDINPNCYKQVVGNSQNLIYDSGSLPPKDSSNNFQDVRSLPSPVNPQPIKNNGCPIYLGDVQSITFTITDALGTRYVFSWQPT
jgi:hypothetical protein